MLIFADSKDFILVYDLESKQFPSLDGEADGITKNPENFSLPFYGEQSIEGMKLKKTLPQKIYQK